MSDTPFQDTATKIANESDYLTMSVRCDRARSHSWWKNVVECGAWRSPGGGVGRVGPPPPETLDGIAKLFGTSVEQVCAMVAADWYGVHPETDVSTRVLRLGPILDQLSDSDAQLVEDIARRLAKSASGNH